jgi:hypothetical protein
MKNEQNSADHNRVDSVCVTTVLSQEQFKEFYSFLNIIEPHFNDLCINKGQFRSPSNDRSIIVETAFTYFENLDFFVTDICLLVKMLSTFDKGTDITITTDKYNITVTDGFRSVHVANATLEFFANEFTSDEKINEYIFDNIDR